MYRGIGKTQQYSEMLHLRGSWIAGDNGFRHLRMSECGSFHLPVRFWASAKFILLKKKKKERKRRKRKETEQSRRETKRVYRTQ